MRILVVEDDHVSRKLISRIMQEYGEVESAVDGSEALGKFNIAHRDGEPFELICLDIMMPGIDGREVLRQVRASEEEMGLSTLDGVKVIMVTALSNFEDVASAFRDQCDGYITKPIQKPQLEATLSSLGFSPMGG